MFRRSYNRAVIRIRLETCTPLLIRAGDTPLDPAAADLTPMRTRHARHGRTVFVPGTSLKGVLRSAAESTLRSRTEAGDLACDPLRRGSSCADGRSANPRENPTEAVHRAHCLTCRLFGSTSMRGRAAPRDLFPWRVASGQLSSEEQENLAATNATELRHNVAIDRRTGSVSAGPFDQELVPPGAVFWGEIGLENYQGWQLALLLMAFDEVSEGRAQLGSSKSRGLGVARLDVEAMVHEQVRGRSDRARGVGALATPSEVEAYGLREESSLPEGERRPRGLADRFEITAEGFDAWREMAYDALEQLG